MPRKSLSEWAAIAEILGAAAVVVSLLFVAHSIERNTTLLQSQNDNLLYEWDSRLHEQIHGDGEFAAIMLKLHKDEPLTEVERLRHHHFMIQYLNMWEMAYDRYMDGLFDEQMWQEWKVALGKELTSAPHRLPRSDWEQVRREYNTGFQVLVDQAYDGNP